MAGGFHFLEFQDTEKMRACVRKVLSVSSAAHSRGPSPAIVPVTPFIGHVTRPTRAPCMTAGGCRAVVVYEDHEVIAGRRFPA